MFKIVNYQPNSAVIVEGKPTNHFFIMRQGEVQLDPEMPIPGEEASQVLKMGDFFGVVSCMSGHPNIETVQTLTLASMVSVERSQFAMLIQKNAPIAMKIIRYFSQRLRIIDKAITKLSFHNIVEENPERMFNLGEYYFGKKEKEQACYSYQKYLQYFPKGSFSEKAKERLSSLSSPLTSPAVQRKNLTASFKDREFIFIEHEPGSELYIIQQGNVKITKIVDQNEVLLAVLNPGDILGEMALLEDKPRSASAIAHGNVMTLAINKANFETMVKAQPQLAVKLITILSTRIWTAYRQLANLLIIHPIGRVYDMLLTLVQKSKTSIQPKASYEFDIGGKELGNMLGFSPGEGEKHIGTLLEDKHFLLNKGKIQCLDLIELEKQVQFYRKKTAMERKREHSKLSRELN